MNTADKDALIESVAKVIYLQWAATPGYVAWVEGGNSFHQDDARYLAKVAVEQAPAVASHPAEMMVDTSATQI